MLTTVCLYILKDIFLFNFNWLMFFDTNSSKIDKTVDNITLNSELITYTRSIMLSLYCGYYTSIIYPPYTLLYIIVHMIWRPLWRKPKKIQAMSRWKFKTKWKKFVKPEGLRHQSLQIINESQASGSFFVLNFHLVIAWIFFGLLHSWRHIIFEVSTVTVFSARAVFVHRDGEEHYVGESWYRAKWICDKTW